MFMTVMSIVLHDVPENTTTMQYLHRLRNRLPKSLTDPRPPQKRTTFIGLSPLLTLKLPHLDVSDFRRTP